MSNELPILTWNEVRNYAENYQEARVGRAPDDRVTFTLTHHRTCYRRGPWRLLIEVCPGPYHQEWGCFDEQDQPMRYFHREENAKSEADEIAKVLLQDRYQNR